MEDGTSRASWRQPHYLFTPCLILASIGWVVMSAGLGLYQHKLYESQISMVMGLGWSNLSVSFLYLSTSIVSLVRDPARRRGAHSAGHDKKAYAALHAQGSPFYQSQGAFAIVLLITIMSIYETNSILSYLRLGDKYNIADILQYRAWQVIYLSGLVAVSLPLVVLAVFGFNRDPIIVQGYDALDPSNGGVRHHRPHDEKRFDRPSSHYAPSHRSRNHQHQQQQHGQAQQLAAQGPSNVLSARPHLQLNTSAAEGAKPTNAGAATAVGALASPQGTTATSATAAAANGGAHDAPPRQHPAAYEAFGSPSNLEMQRMALAHDHAEPHGGADHALQSPIETLQPSVKSPLSPTFSTQSKKVHPHHPQQQQQQQQQQQRTYAAQPHQNPMFSSYPPSPTDSMPAYGASFATHVPTQPAVSSPLAQQQQQPQAQAQPQQTTTKQANGMAGAMASRSPSNATSATTSGGQYAMPELMATLQHPITVRALYSYDASPDDPSELSFEKGDVLTVIANDGRWWRAKRSPSSAAAAAKNGDAASAAAVETGIIPSNYLTVLGGGIPAASASSGST